jgi:Mce-associated membrane protein
MMAAEPGEQSPVEGFAHQGARGKVALVSIAVAGLATLLVLSGLMLHHLHGAAQREQHIAEFAAAARQAVVNLMSLDFTKGEQDVQRVINTTTGQFRDEFLKTKDDVLKVMKESKVVIKIDVKVVGVESMTDNSADVLVAATSRVSSSTSAQQPPHAWRLGVTVEKDGGALKMSKVEFIP